jgi:DNA-binding NarL/FixJ family response regulator
MVEANSRIRLVIADQQPLFLRGICASLRQIPDIEVIGEVGSAQELLSIINTQQPDVVLLDTELSYSSNPDLSKTIKQRLPSVAVILITSKQSDAELFEAIRSRASGYLQRDVTPDELVSTIRKTANGYHPINDTLFGQPKVAEKVLQQFQDMSWGRGVETFVSPLTLRETEVLNCIARGNSNKQIAVELSISEQTIKNHITSILRKLDANARTQAVVTAIKRGLITLS